MARWVIIYCVDLSFHLSESSAAEWSAHRTGNPAVPGPSLALTTTWICGVVSLSLSLSSVTVNKPRGRYDRGKILLAPTVLRRHFCPIYFASHDGVSERGTTHSLVSSDCFSLRAHPCLLRSRFCYVTLLRETIA